MCVHSLDADRRLFGTQGAPHTHTQTHSQKREARQMLTEEQQDTWMSLLVLEHSMTVEGVQTGHKRPGLGVPQTHTREQL